MDYFKKYNRINKIADYYFRKRRYLKHFKLMTYLYFYPLKNKNFVITTFVISILFIFISIYFDIK